MAPHGVKNKLRHVGISNEKEKFQSFVTIYTKKIMQKVKRNLIFKFKVEFLRDLIYEWPPQSTFNIKFPSKCAF